MEFNEKFETYSNAELLRIIRNPVDYQAQAVETAKIIFAGRQLSAAEIETAENELETELQQKQIARDKVKISANLLLTSSIRCKRKRQQRDVQLQ